MELMKVEQGLLAYINNELIAKATGTTKFLLYAGVALATPKMEEMFNQYKDNSIIQALEIVRGDGTINVDALYNAMKHAMNKMGTVEYMGIKFNSDDVDKLYNYIHTA